jgi:hypothetical protein
MTRSFDAVVAAVGQRVMSDPCSSIELSLVNRHDESGHIRVSGLTDVIHT